MAEQKLYTYEQMIEAFNYGQNPKGFDWIGDMINSLDAIELPSDEEISKVALENTNNINEQVLFNNGAIYVCKLIEEQILNQNK